MRNRPVPPLPLWKLPTPSLRQRIAYRIGYWIWRVRLVHWRYYQTMCPHPHTQLCNGRYECTRCEKLFRKVRG